jgi:Kdo2-lipid IVA lauroyltransferase/acyltransferase
MAGKKKKKKGKKKSKLLQLIEYGALQFACLAARLIPARIMNGLCTILGNITYALVSSRREIALENLRMAYKGELTEREIRSIARRSCRSFFLLAAEMMRIPFRRKAVEAMRDSRYESTHLEALFRKAKEVHDQSHGCIFVTPHLGNWEFLPYAGALVGIPLVIVIRPLDNKYLEKAILSNRAGSGQVLIPKKNALFSLQRVLQRGKSIGILPDQATGRGIWVDFFGTKATLTPAPALLAITYNRPIVVVACCRTKNPRRYEGYVSDPIWPRENPDEKEEILRLSTEMNRKMEEVIRRYPDQYLWMHNRWKKYKRKAIFEEGR